MDAILDMDNWIIKAHRNTTHSQKLTMEAKLIVQKKRRPNNDGLTSPKNIQIDDDYKFIDYSESDPEGIRIVSRKWFRKIDENGNAYFLTSKHSKLLYSAFDIFLDATFAPTLGFKHLFPQLEIFSTTKDLGNKKMLGIPCAFVLTTSNKGYSILGTTISNTVHDSLQDGQIVDDKETQRPPEVAI